MIGRGREKAIHTRSNHKSTMGSSDIRLDRSLAARRPGSGFRQGAFVWWMMAAHAHTSDDDDERRREETFRVIRRRRKAAAAEESGLSG